MSLMPNLKGIFKENLDAIANKVCNHGNRNDGTCGDCKQIKEKHGGEAFGKSLQDISTHHKVDIKELEKQLEKGIGIEGEHGEDKARAKKVAMDHLWENPKYYTKLVSCGLEEPIEEGLLGSLGNAAVGAVKGAISGAMGNKPGQNQGQDPSQMDPNVYKKYQAEKDKLSKQKDTLTKQLQKLNQDIATLSKKYNVNPGA